MAIMDFFKMRKPSIPKNHHYFEEQVLEDFAKQIWETKRTVEPSKLNEVFEKIEGIDFNTSKEILSSVMFHSYLLLRQLNLFYKEVEYGDLRYIKVVSGLIADMLHNAPRMLVNKHYPASPQEIQLKMIKEVIVEYTIFMEVLQQHIESTPKLQLKNTTYHTWLVDYNLDDVLPVV